LHRREPAAAESPADGETAAKTGEEIKVQIIDISVKFLHYAEDDCCFFLPMTDTGHPHRIGYARVSTLGQNLDSQVDALTQAGCLKIFSDRLSGVTQARPGWDALRAYLRPGDTVVVTELSRMTRSLLHLLELVKEFEAGKIDVVSLRENIDTTTAMGRCFLSITGAIAQMERELKAERAAAGRQSAKARGRTGGRPRTDSNKLEEARILYENSNKTAAEVCRSLGVGRRTLFSYLAAARAK
jgi:DNA invertase Pin-like site-specific DNA recombinase